MRRGRPLPPETRRAVSDRSRGICEARLFRYGCSTAATEMHHVKLRSRGGSNDPGNILHLCGPCHRAVTVMRPGTERFRTHSWQQEGRTEADFGGDENV